MGIFSKPYQHLVKLSKDALRDTMAPLRAREMKLKALTRMAELESKIAEAEQAVHEAGSAYPLDFDLMMRKLDDVALLKRQHDQLKTITSELFPDGEGA